MRRGSRLKYGVFGRLCTVALRHSGTLKACNIDEGQD
jgi:hypothetical protein